jgi:hypothetical protein
MPEPVEGAGGEERVKTIAGASRVRMVAFNGTLLRALVGTSAAAERVRHGEALEAVAALGLLADDVEDGVDELGALGVVALGPVVARARLAEDEVVRAEDLQNRGAAHRKR